MAYSSQKNPQEEIPEDLNYKNLVSLITKVTVSDDGGQRIAEHVKGNHGISRVCRRSSGPE